jgi:predicted phage terminase large subunit-like protein
VVFAGARDSFHLCLLAVEWNRDPEKKFYAPRRKVLREVVRALQDLEDGVIELAAISLPPGAGKTTLAIFYLCWIAGRHPEEPTLTGSHSNSFVRGVYDECLRIFDSNGEYLWYEVFPETQVVNTNAKDCRIDLGKRKRFETLEFTSIGTGNAGLYRAMHLLYCDDLVSGIEVALNKERLDKLWETYTTDLRQRKIGDHCGELHIATRWSVHDVIGRLEAMYGDSPKARFIVIPAMDENDESNFDYAYGVGFNTQFYRQQRDIMDDASWRALYMNQPIERDGLLYQADELRRYFELPEGDPDAIISICDTKDKGTDYAFMPVGYVYGQDYYIEDCICDNGLPEIVDVRLADILVRHKVKQSRFESNSAGGRVAEKVQQMVKDRGGVTHITTKYTTANKETKIIVNSAWVKEHCLFRDETTYKRNSEYGKMISMLCSYTMAGKNKNDDVPDGMAMFAEYAQSFGGNQVTVFQRPW